MRSKQRLLGAIRGEEIDRIPWSPFLAYYWESLPRETREKGQFAFLREMGADPLLRGFHRLSKYTYRNCTIEQKSAGRESCTLYHTPVGDLKEKFETANR